MNRLDIITEAAERCMKELYKFAQPKVTWEEFVELNKQYKEGKKPYEYYYLSKENFQSIVEMYKDAYRIPCEIPDVIKGFKNYAEGKLLPEVEDIKTQVSKEDWEIFNDYLNKFTLDIRWDSHYENSFNLTVYLGASPNSNKEAVIANWKERGVDIEIKDIDIWDEEFE